MILDAVLAALLLVTIIYCWRLSRKVAAIHASKRELQTLISAFDEAINRAENGILQLRDTTDQADKILQQHIEKARFLSNDLAFLAHKGNNVADRLEDYIHQSRHAEQPFMPKTTRISKAAGVPINPSLSSASGSKRIGAGTLPQRIATPPAQQVAPKREEPAEASAAWRKVNAASPAPAKPKPHEMPQSKRAALDEVLSKIEERRKRYAGGGAGSENAPLPASSSEHKLFT